MHFEPHIHAPQTVRNVSRDFLKVMSFLWRLHGVTGSEGRVMLHWVRLALVWFDQVRLGYITFRLGWGC